MSGIARIDGDLDLTSVSAWLARADELIEHDALDLSGVGRIDSAGVSLLLELRRRAQARGRPLHLAGAAQRLRDLLEFLGVGALLGAG